jgi:hypothetical protein
VGTAWARTGQLRRAAGLEEGRLTQGFPRGNGWATRARLRHSWGPWREYIPNLVRLICLLQEGPSPGMLCGVAKPRKDVPVSNSLGRPFVPFPQGHRRPRPAAAFSGLRCPVRDCDAPIARAPSRVSARAVRGPVGGLPLCPMCSGHTYARTVPMIETWNDRPGHVGPGPDSSGAGSPSTAGIDLRFELVLRAHRHGSQRLGSAECRRQR